MVLIGGAGHAENVPLADRRLQTFVERIWLSNGASDSPVAVTLGDAPTGHTVAEEYWVLPHPHLSRFLVPLATRDIATASLRCYNATRAPLSRAVRGGLAAALARGVGGLARRSRLVISVDSRVPRDRWADFLITTHLAEQLNIPELHAFVAVRQLNPNAKPTLQLFDAAAKPVAYAKLGTTFATRALVRNEAAAIQRLGSLADPIVPRLLSAGHWNDTAYTVSSPLPLDLGRFHGSVDQTIPTLRHIAEAGTRSYGPVVGSSYAARLRSEIAAVSDQRALAPLLTHWLDAIERSPLPISFGGNHGDWIPNNIGVSGSRFAVWDWEHSTPDAPNGFDLLHWHFHHALVGSGLEAASAAVDFACAELAALDQPATSTRLVGSLYLLDISVRRARLASGGGGWNARWWPEILTLAGKRSGLDYAAA